MHPDPGYFAQEYLGKHQTPVDTHVSKDGLTQVSFSDQFIADSQNVMRRAQQVLRLVIKM